jgi:hypothetical protein
MTTKAEREMSYKISNSRDLTNEICWRYISRKRIAAIVVCYPYRMNIVI